MQFGLIIVLTLNCSYKPFHIKSAVKRTCPIAVRCRDIGYPSLMTKSVMTQVDRKNNRAPPLIWNS